MEEQPATRVKIGKFQGQVSQANPHDLEPNMAQIQLNLAILVPGEMVTRMGLRELTFDTE